MFCSDVFRLDSDRFKNLSDTERFTLKSGAEQICPGTETASKAAFLKCVQRKLDINGTAIEMHLLLF